MSVTIPPNMISSALAIECDASQRDCGMFTHKLINKTNLIRNEYAYRMWP